MRTHALKSAVLLFGLILGLLFSQAFFHSLNVRASGQVTLPNTQSYRVGAGTELNPSSWVLRFENTSNEATRLDLNFRVPNGFGFINLPETIRIQANETWAQAFGVLVDPNVALGDYDLFIDVVQDNQLLDTFRVALKVEVSYDVRIAIETIFGQAYTAEFVLIQGADRNAIDYMNLFGSTFSLSLPEGTYQLVDVKTQDRYAFVVQDHATFSWIRSSLQLKIEGMSWWSRQRNSVHILNQTATDSWFNLVRIVSNHQGQVLERTVVQRFRGLAQGEFIFQDQSGFNTRLTDRVAYQIFNQENVLFAESPALSVYPWVSWGAGLGVSGLVLGVLAWFRLKQGSASLPQAHETLNHEAEAGTNEPHANLPGTLLEAGMTVQGNLTVKGNLTIFGRVVGDVRCTGTLDLKPGGSIVGDVFAENLIVHGSIYGKIKTRKMDIKRQAYIQGQFDVLEMTVESGARISGDFQS